MKTVGEVLHEQVRARGDADFVVSEYERLTYADAEARSRAVARGLLAEGVGKGARLAMLHPTGIPFVVTWLAIVRIGAVAVPISTFSKADELRDILARADAGMLLGTAAYRGNDFADALRTGCGLDLSAPAPCESPAVPSLRRVHLDGDSDGDATVHADHSLAALVEAGEAVDDDLLAAIEADVTPADRMVIVHTSGSTSAPKGVIHQHGPLVRHLDNLNGLRQLDTGVKLFSNSPMFWIGGLAYNALGTLVAGATLVCPTSADTGVALDFLERERPELVNGFAQSIAGLMADRTFASRDFTSIRSGNLYAIMPAGLQPRDPELRHNMLGMTEAGSVCLMDPDESDQPEHRRGSFGRPVPELEARVVDPETLVAQPAEELGELWLRGPLLMEGYYGRERWTTFTPDEWYRTGDAFRRDEDGLLYFLGRRDDMIKTGGANVSPREVEAVLRDVTGGLLPIVFGLPDAERGAIVAAVVVADTDVPLDTQAVHDALRARLSAYKVPRKIVRFTPTELPMLSSGKPDMRRLVEVVGES
ncbi:MAG TPA: class I adenylate-forming enzyme family protein [Acidimicrobiia bacterium]|nr:class I adenylate-forming enzyme family protein [Acidimicrobiia bacterium]